MPPQSCVRVTPDGRLTGAQTRRGGSRAQPAPGRAAAIGAKSCRLPARTQGRSVPHAAHPQGGGSAPAGRARPRTRQLRQVLRPPSLVCRSRVSQRTEPREHRWRV